MREAGVSEPPNIVGVRVAWDELTEHVSAGDLSLAQDHIGIDGTAAAPSPLSPSGPLTIDVPVPAQARPGALVDRQPAPSPVAVEVADRYARALALDVEVPAPSASRSPRRSRAAMRDRALRPDVAPSDRPRRSPAVAPPARRAEAEPKPATVRTEPRRAQATVAPPPSGPGPAPSRPRTAAAPTASRSARGAGASSPARTSAAARRSAPAHGSAPARASAPARNPGADRASSASRSLSLGEPPSLPSHADAPIADPGTGAGRRTVTIRGRGAERDLGWSAYQSRRRPAVPAHERPGFRPDRAAMWAVFLGLILVLVAATSSHAATLAAHALH